MLRRSRCDDTINRRGHLELLLTHNELENKQGVLLPNDHIIAISSGETYLYTQISFQKSRSMRHGRPKRRESQSSASPVFLWDGRLKT